MAEVFRLPKMGQTMTEATILRWLKEEGDHVEGWEGVVEMMTDKIDMEVETGFTGTLLRRLAAEGEVVPLGRPICIVGAPGEDLTELLAALAGEGGAPAAGEPADRSESAPAAANGGGTLATGEVLQGEPFANVSPRAREAARAAGLDWKTLTIAGSGQGGVIVERDVAALIAATPPAPSMTPLAAKIAADLGVRPEDLSGSGTRGRITAGDVRRAGRPAGPSIQPREIPLQGMRKIIASRLSASYSQAVHVPLRTDVDMSAAAELRRQLKPVAEAMGARITYTDLLAAAAARALVAHPELNATLENDVIRIHPNVHLGIAVALDEGLTVPVVREAELLSLPELSRAVQAAAAGARGGSLPPDAYAGGTLTISNLGQFGVDNFDPIINPPQLAILGCGGIRERVVPVEGVPAVRPMMTLTVCFDHRATDGAPAARFLATVRELLENPARLLL